MLKPQKQWKMMLTFDHDPTALFEEISFGLTNEIKLIEPL